MQTFAMSAVAQGAFVACIILPLLASAVVVLRVVARLRNKEKLKSDDWTMIVATILAIGIAATYAYGLSVGAAMGLPSSITGNSVVLTYELDIIVEQLYGIAEALIKISILLFYRRILATDAFYRVANWSIGLVAVWALLFLLLFIFPVWPISTSWTPGQHSHQNYDWTKVLLTHAVTNIALDLFILCLPLPVIWGLHMSRARKVAVAGIMWLGAFCVIASCVRLSYVVGVGRENVQTAGTGSDAVSEAALWSIIEPCCSVIAGCLPTLGPLVKGTKLASWTSSRVRKVAPSSSQQVTFVSPAFIQNGSEPSRLASAGSAWHLRWPRKFSKSQSRQSSLATLTSAPASEHRAPQHHPTDMV